MAPHPRRIRRRPGITADDDDGDDDDLPRLAVGARSISGEGCHRSATGVTGHRQTTTTTATHVLLVDLSILGCCGRIGIPRRHVVTLSYVLFCLSLILLLGGGLPSGQAVHRYLEEMIPEEIRFTGARISTAPQERTLTHSEILKSTLKIYGTLSAVMFVAYVMVRKRYPRAYNVRGTACSVRSGRSGPHDYPDGPEHGQHGPNDIACPLAAKYFNQFTSLSWTYELWYSSGSGGGGMSYDDIYNHAGLDAVSLIRLLEFGAKISVVGILQSLYLFPVYYYIGEHVHHPATASITDPVQNLSLSNLPPGHPSAITTTLSAYILSITTMYLLLQEMKWFTTYCHRYLSEKFPNNYTIYVTGIPNQLRNDDAIRSYFEECFGYNSVLEANVVLDLPSLERRVAERDGVVTKLEHAINVRNVRNVVVQGGGGNVKGGDNVVGPTHKTGPMGLCGHRVDSIEYYTKELRWLNDEIGQAIDAVEAARRERDAAAAAILVIDNVEACAGASDDEDSKRDARDLILDVETTLSVVDSVTSGNGAETPPKKTRAKTKTTSTKSPSALSFSPASESRLQSMESLAESVTSSALNMIFAKDGGPRSAAFVTFSNLASTNGALQMIEERPFVMDPTEAPRPDDVCWNNVGLSHARRQFGRLLGLSLSTLLCLFWTIPVGFVATFSNLSALTELFPRLGTYLESHPWLDEFLAQLAPLLLVTVVAMLPVILQMIAKLEGHASHTAVQASLFAKLSWFTIIQTFFISAISGSVTQEIQNLIISPIHAVDLLAKSLPAQSAYFMQIMLVQTLLGGVGIELLRVSAVGMAAVRRCVGPNLTEKERNTTWMGLRPLADPLEYLYARKLGSEVILLFMVLFCYASMAPLTCYVCGFCFVLLAIVLRNQFLFIYPTHNDTGGKLWVNFVQIIVICMIIAQVALIGVLSLKRNKIAAPLLVPLPIVTLLFSIYLKQKHYYVTTHLPTKICVQADKENDVSRSIANYAFVKGKYLQPPLRNKAIFPDNFDEKATGTSDAKASLKKDWLGFLNRSPYRKGKVAADVSIKK